MKPLNLNNLIKQVTYPLSTIMRKKIRLKTVLADVELRILGDWERIGHAVASLVEYGNTLIREQGTISIETRMVAVASNLGTNSGCALVSITSTDTERVLKRVDQDLFSLIIGIVKNHNGSLRILSQEGKAAANIYLPLLVTAADVD